MNPTLICFPFAGGNKFSYEFLRPMKTDINVICVDYPGRGSKMSESLVDDIHLLVGILYDELRNVFQKEDFSFFGHSLGGLVSYLLAQQLCKIGEHLPRELFISGTACPSSNKRNRGLHLLTRDEFYQELSKLNGLPKEFQNSKELQLFFEPVLRTDVMVSEKYRHTESEPLPVPLTIMFGQKEKYSIEDIVGWKRESAFRVNFHEFPGDHFFIYEGQQKIRDIIRQKLNNQ